MITIEKVTISKELATILEEYRAKKIKEEPEQAEFLRSVSLGTLLSDWLFKNVG